MRTPLSRVRHLGSARGGTGNFWLERITGVASLVLTVFFVGLLVGLAGRTHGEVVAVIGLPWIAALAVMFVVAVTLHMRVGMEAIIVDYVHNEARKVAWLMANTFFTIAAGTVTILAILVIALGN